MTKKTFIAAGLALLGAGLAAPANAGEYQFSFRSHELATSQGREVLFERIGRKAEGVCGVGRRQSLSMTRAAKDCKQDVVADIVRKIGDDRLANLADGRRSLRVAQQ